MSGCRLTLAWVCRFGLAAAALLGGAAPAAGGDSDGAEARTTAPTTAPTVAPSVTPSVAPSAVPTAALTRQLDEAQSLLQSRLAVLPADSGVLLLRDPDRLILRIPARLVFEYDTAVLWQQQPTAVTQDQAPAPLALPLLATVQLLNKYRALRAQIVVYTDSIGGVGANQTLSDARAQAVYHALTAAGIAPERLQQHGAGAATSVAGNQTPQGRIENRRVEIEFRPEPAAAP